MRDHFPFWRPIVFTLLMVAVPTAVFFGAKLYTARLWGAPAHARAECRAAAGFAKTILRTKVLIELSKNPIQFSPILQRPPTEFIDGSLPDWLKSMRGYLLMPSPLDCSPEFVGLPLIPPQISEPTHQEDLVTRVRFSRVLFAGIDNSRAYVSIDDYCGNVCGNGWQTEWRRRDGEWTLASFHMLWIS